MNVSLDLTKAQLSKLRNGHGIRINSKMVGSGMDLIVDPLNFNNMAKKLDKGKGVILKLGSNEIDMNKMEGSGLFAGAGNKSGKISRFKKANRWRDFSKDTVNIGMDLGDRALEMYNKQKERPQEKAKESAAQLAGLFGKGLKLKQSRPKINKPPMMPPMMPTLGKGLKVSSGDGLRVRGDGLRVRGGMCCGCGAMMNDKFLFSDQAL